MNAPQALIDAARVGVPDPRAALSVLADALLERGAVAGEPLRLALADPELEPLGLAKRGVDARGGPRALFRMATLAQQDWPRPTDFELVVPDCGEVRPFLLACDDHGSEFGLLELGLSLPTIRELEVAEVPMVGPSSAESGGHVWRSTLVMPTADEWDWPDEIETVQSAARPVRCLPASRAWLRAFLREPGPIERERLLARLRAEGEAGLPAWRTLVGVRVDGWGEMAAREIAALGPAADETLHLLAHDPRPGVAQIALGAIAERGLELHATEPIPTVSLPASMVLPRLGTPAWRAWQVIWRRLLVLGAIGAAIATIAVWGLVPVVTVAVLGYLSCLAMCLVVFSGLWLLRASPRERLLALCGVGVLAQLVGWWLGLLA